MNYTEHELYEEFRQLMYDDCDFAMQYNDCEQDFYEWVDAYQ